MTSDAENSRAASGSLEADRLAAAVNAVADRYDPDQIILFGSAARGEMTEGSDIDLLVINDHRHPEANAPGAHAAERRPDRCRPDEAR